MANGGRRERKREVVGEHHEHSVPLAYRDGGEYVQITVEHSSRGRGEAVSRRLPAGVYGTLVKPTSGADLSPPGAGADRHRGAKPLPVMTVHQILEPGLSDFVE